MQGAGARSRSRLLQVFDNTALLGRDETFSLGWFYLVLLFPDKDKAVDFFIESPKVLLKYLSTKRMDLLKIIRVNKDLMKTLAMLD